MVQHVIVGICGPKFSGKDTAAATLCRSFQYVQASFASFLKEACRSIFMLSHNQLHGDEKETLDERWGITPRQILQKVGTELFRQRLPEVLPQLNLGGDGSLWCHCMRLWLETFETPQRIVITDVRFRDEEALIRSLGGKIVRIERASRPVSDDHASEVEQAAIVADYVIHNDGSYADLAREVTRVATLIVPTVASIVRGKQPPVRGVRLDHFPVSVEDLEAHGEPVNLSEPKKQRIE